MQWKVKEKMQTSMRPFWPIQSADPTMNSQLKLQNYENKCANIYTSRYVLLLLVEDFTAPTALQLLHTGHPPGFKLPPATLGAPHLCTVVARCASFA